MTRRTILAYARRFLPTELARMATGGYAAACPRLTAAEKALIHHYTATGSQPLNAELHQGTVSVFGLALAAAIARLPCYAGPIVRSAGYLSAAQLAHYVACAASGTTVYWPAFFSTSTSAAVAKRHLGYGQKNVLFSIAAPKTGRLIEAISYYGSNGPDPADSEDEVLFLPGTGFRVLSVAPATSYHVIVLEEVDSLIPLVSP